MDPQRWPAAAGYIINIAMAAIVAFGFLPRDTAHGIAVAVVALTSLVVAFMVHPFVWGAASGAFQTLLVSLGAFGFHLTDEQTSAVVALAGLIAAIVTHTLVVPQIAHRKGLRSVADLPAAAPAGAP